MKIVILAAGIGSRLGNPFPKPLTPLENGKSIMQIQVELLSEAFKADDIQVVVGFKKELIMERFPELTFIYNPYFDQTNTSKSLLRALKKHKGQDVLWLNGDVVFDRKLLEALQPVIGEGASFVSVNTGRVGDEEIKYTLKEGFVDQLSKELKNGLGEAVGINFITAADLPALIRGLEDCADTDYFEKGLELAIARDGLRIRPLDISVYNCMEVDFKEDLENANSMLRG